LQQEKNLRKQARMIQELQKKISSIPTSTAPQTPQWSKEDIKKQVLQDPTSFGLTHDELTNLLVNSPTPENQKITALEAKIAELEAGHKKTISSVEEQNKKAYDQALNQISREVESLVNTDESFETIKATSNVAAVVALIEETYKEEGYIMTTEDAAKAVEEHLVEEALSLAKLKKIQSKLNPQTEQQTQTQQQTSTKSTSPTLTHAITQSSTKALSMKERRERAIAAFQGTLK
jgi:antitoxin component HigA of HigAB toxin-antitoxin module